MPPARRAHGAQDAPTLDRPVSSQNRTQLDLLAYHFNLEQEGQLTVNQLRALINDHLDNNPQLHNLHPRLYGRRQPVNARQPSRTPSPSQRSNSPSNTHSTRTRSTRSQRSVSSQRHSTPSTVRPDSTFRGIPSRSPSVSSRKVSESPSIPDPFQPTQDWLNDLNDNGTDPHLGVPPPQRPTQRTARPERRPGRLAVGAGYIIPDSVTKIFKSGWTSHVSLSLLTDANCLYSNASLSDPHENVVLNTSTGRVSTSAAPLSVEKEYSLSFDEWHQSWQRLHELIRDYVPNEREAWLVHYNRVLGSPTRSEHWPLWLAYDIEIRRRAVREGFNIACYHPDIWRDLELRYLKSESKNTTSRRDTTTEGPFRNNYTTPYRYGSSSYQRREHSFRPYPSRREWNSERQFSNDRYYSNERHYGKPGRCIFCGDSSRSHASKECKATTNVKGHPCHLAIRNTGEPPRDNQGETYCFAWNGYTGCNRGQSCKFGKHWRSLCGDKSHSAQSCPSF
ncbi:hypothetical protein FA15DRAFT_648017 [Coprinopsis marcescibilis]|uniref:C3H1-type domain-containing protein n=1 Tax=Coprinopsis marcescibilis TaxID=230819 RepID=A0A5C3KI65_COPMA|nr:hypothetical protein FA15DRAFT_648017 [Coprinopsis marcescibilis]